MDRHASIQTSIAPEVEVYSVGCHQMEDNEDGLDRDKEYGTMLQFVASKQDRKDTIQEPLDDTTSESSDKSDFEFGSHCTSTYSGDDHSTFSLTMYDSIVAIRKEASKIDAVLAFDQLETLKEDVRELTRSIKERSRKTKELEELVQIKDDRIGTLELERDLYKADTNKLANDLECCLVKLRRVGEAPSDMTNADLEPGTPGGSLEHFVRKKQPSRKYHEVQHSAEPQNRLDPPSCATTTCSRTAATVSITSRSEAFPRSTPVYEKPRLTNVIPQVQSSRNAGRYRDHGRVPNLGSPESRSQLEEMGISYRELEPRGFLQEQVQELSHRLMIALGASEDLRRRLATLSRYYENHIMRLRHSLVEAKADRSQIEFDLLRRITVLERENSDSEKDERDHVFESSL